VADLMRIVRKEAEALAAAGERETQRVTAMRRSRTDVADEVSGKTVSHVTRPYARRLEIHFARRLRPRRGDLTNRGGA
jgi:rubrerythrin